MRTMAGPMRDLGCLCARHKQHSDLTLGHAWARSTQIRKRTMLLWVSACTTVSNCKPHTCIIFSSLSSLLPPLQRTLFDPNPSLFFESLLRALVCCTTSGQAASVMSHPLASGSICIDDKTSQTQHMQRVRPSGFQHIGQVSSAQYGHSFARVMCCHKTLAVARKLHTPFGLETYCLTSSSSPSTCCAPPV